MDNTWIYYEDTAWIIFMGIYYHRLYFRYKSFLYFYWWLFNRLNKYQIFTKYCTILYDRGVQIDISNYIYTIVGRWDVWKYILRTVCTHDSIWSKSVATVYSLFHNICSLNIYFVEWNVYGRYNKHVQMYIFNWELELQPNTRFFLFLCPNHVLDSKKCKTRQKFCFSCIPLNSYWTVTQKWILIYPNKIQKSVI